MSEHNLVCWICCHVSTCDNSVTIVNEEQICDECMHELAQIVGEMGEESFKIVKEEINVEQMVAVFVEAANIVKASMESHP